MADLIKNISFGNEELLKPRSIQDEGSDGIFEIFSNLTNLMQVFESSSGSSFIDLVALEKWYSELKADKVCLNAFNCLFDQLKHEVQDLRKNQTTALIIVLRHPLLNENESYQLLMPKISHTLASLSQSQRIEFAWTLQESLLRSDLESKGSASIFKHIVSLFNRFITQRVIEFNADMDLLYKDELLISAVQSLAILSAINDASNFLPCYDFYNEAVETCLDMKEDYPRFKGKEGFCFISYPFLLSTAAKNEVLRLESLVRMRHELQDAFFRAMFVGVNSPYLQMDIRRNHVIRDAVVQLESRRAYDFKKQLRVTFVGEDGIDEGGVQKEFFKLSMDTIFDPEYGMFAMNPDSRLCWFTIDNTKDIHTVEEYRMLGILIGLAIYNGVVLDIKFPLALYKKLLNHAPSIEDLHELDPQLAKGLEGLLDFDGDIEDIYGYSFEVQFQTYYGERISYLLKPGGDQIVVSKDNRREFVDLYVQAYFDSMPEVAFGAFKEGFDSTLSGSVIDIFRPEELAELVVGSPTLDFKELEENTQYDGFEKSSTIVQYFWEIVHMMDDQTKKKLLSFTTGSDKVPIGGLAKLPFIIAKNGGDSDRLPTSHTCYNVLLLSEYASKEKLENRLLKALENGNCGFFLN